MGLWVRAYAFVICYRFREDLTAPLTTRYTVELVDIQKKATGSLTTTGVFFGLSIALMATFLGDTGEKLKDLVRCAASSPGSWVLLSACSFLGVLVPYFVVRTERAVTAASVGAKTEEEKCAARVRQYILLVLYICFGLFLYLLAPKMWPKIDIFLRAAFPASGFVLIIFSVLFLLFALEFYDSASSWRGKDPPLHFHLASIAATSYLFGICFALIGASLLLCMLAPWLGRITTVAALVAVTGMSEIERGLWDLSHASKSSDGSAEDGLPT